MPNSRRHLYEFGPFRLSETEGVLWRDGEVLALTPKGFNLLLALVKSRGQVLAKAELLSIVWAGTAVDESNLPTQIAILRKVIGVGFVENVHSRGYRFTAEVTERWEEQTSPGSEAGVAPVNVNVSLEMPDSGGVKSRRTLSPLRGYLGVLLAAAVLACIAAIGFALRVGHHADKPMPPISKAGRILAQATSEGGRALELKLDHDPDELLITPDGRKLYSIEYHSKKITVLDFLRLKVKGTIDLPSAVRSATMTRDGKRIYAGSHTEGVMVVDTEHDTVLDRILPTGGPVYSLAVTPDEKRLFLAMGSAGLKRISTRTKENRLLSGFACPMFVEIDPDGRELYVSYQCGGPGGRSGHDALEIYEMNSEQVVATVSGPPMVSWEPSFAPNSPWVLLPGRDACLISSYDHLGCPSVPSGVYHLLSSTDHKIVKTLSMPVDNMAGPFAPDGRRIVLSGGSIAVVDPFRETVLEKFAGTGESYGRVVFTPAGDRTIIPVTPKGILVLDMLNAACLPPTQGVFNLYTADGTLDDERQTQPLVAEGGLKFAPGLIGQAFLFNGKNSLLRSTQWGACGDCRVSWSESFYVKFNALGGDMTILRRLRSAKDPDHRLLKSRGNRIVLEVGDGSEPGTSVSAPEPISTGTWYHVAVVTENGGQTLYVNGISIGRIRLPLPRLTPPLVDRSGAYVGVYVGSSPDRSNFLSGLLDELAFYDRALSASEVKGMYALSLPPRCSSGAHRR